MATIRSADPEVLEQRFPVRVKRFTIRHQSGGDGRHRGGNGVVRELEFLDDLEVALLSQRRAAFAPYGLQGGEPGKKGRNILRPRQGTSQELEGLASFHVAAGDILVVKTPGGGGFGSAANSDNDDSG